MVFYPAYQWKSCMIFLLAASFGRTEILKRAVSFSLSSRSNQTGHSVTQISMDKTLSQSPDHWNLAINHNVTEELGMQRIHLDSIFTAIPSRPADYEYFPGVGYYKFHTETANGFDDAVSKCAKEGGHLAIVNSEAEHQVLSTMFQRHPKLKLDYAYVGFHGRLVKRQFVTIFGDPLNKTGFTRWSHPHQPDNNGGAEDCGSVYRNGGLNDATCDASLPFFCEYDLSW